MKTMVYSLRTLSHLHCGIGQGLNDIDLPTARHAVSGHPVVPGSSLKGVLKDELMHARTPEDEPQLLALFGADAAQGSNLFASAISGGDALLLAVPVRSFYGTFGYLASPYTLEVLRNHLLRAGESTGIPSIPTLGIDDPENPIYKVILTEGSVLQPPGGTEVLLEELDLLIDDAQQALAEEWASIIARRFFPDEEGRGIFRKRFAIVDDNALSFLCDTALPVDARIAINDETGTVKDGALWYEETVAPETLFTGVATVDRSYYSECRADADTLSAIVTQACPILCQLGGKATTGKGYVSIDLTASEKGAA